MSIAIRKARKLIRRRQRWRFLQSVAPGDLPESEAPAASAEVSEALRSTYRIFSRMPVDDRVVTATTLADLGEKRPVILRATSRQAGAVLLPFLSLLSMTRSKRRSAVTALPVPLSTKPIPSTPNGQKFVAPILHRFF